MVSRATECGTQQWWLDSNVWRRAAKPILRWNAAPAYLSGDPLGVTLVEAIYPYRPDKSSPSAAAPGCRASVQDISGLLCAVAQTHGRCCEIFTKLPPEPHMRGYIEAMSRSGVRGIFPSSSLVILMRSYGFAYSSSCTRLDRGKELAM